MSIFRPRWIATRLQAKKTPQNALLARCLAYIHANPDEFESWFGGRVMIGDKFGLSRVLEDGDFSSRLFLDISGERMKEERVLKPGWRPVTKQDIRLEIPWYWRPDFEEAHASLSLRKANAFLAKSEVAP